MRKHLSKMSRSGFTNLIAPAVERDFIAILMVCNCNGGNRINLAQLIKQQYC